MHLFSPWLELEIIFRENGRDFCEAEERERFYIEAEIL